MNPPEKILLQFSDFKLPEDFKNVAFLVLSDAKMVRQKVVNPHALASTLGFDVSYAEVSSKKRGVIANRADGIHIQLNYNLSSLETNFELALLISSVILYDLKKNIPVNYQMTHGEGEEGQEGNMFAASEQLAKIFLAFSFTKRELGLLKTVNSEKKISKLAHKKGLPTRFLLQRLGEEMNIN